jgi:N-acetylglutamate synthase-like GNAT family acetyltransferase
MESFTLIRNAVPSDYDRIIGNIDGWWGGREMASMLPRLFFTHFQPWTYVAERDRAVLAFLAGLRSQTNPDQVYCHFIGVAPAARGAGLGEALYQRLWADAASQGCREILAVTSPQNSGSIAFHRRLGFETLEGPDEFAGVSFSPGYDGPGEDRVRFRKTLNAPN